MYVFPSSCLSVYLPIHSFINLYTSFFLSVCMSVFLCIQRLFGILKYTNSTIFGCHFAHPYFMLLDSWVPLSCRRSSCQTLTFWLRTRPTPGTTWHLGGTRIHDRKLIRGRAKRSTVVLLGVVEPEVYQERLGVCIVPKRGTDVYVYRQIYTYIDMYIYTYAIMYVCMHARVYVCMYLFIYVCMCVCMYIHTYICDDHSHRMTTP